MGSPTNIPLILRYDYELGILLCYILEVENLCSRQPIVYIGEHENLCYHDGACKSLSMTTILAWVIIIGHSICNRLVVDRS
jgi:hypothetical protein